MYRIKIIYLAIQSTSYGKMSCDHIKSKPQKTPSIIQTPEKLSFDKIVDFKTGIIQNSAKSPAQTITPLITPIKSPNKTPIQYGRFKTKKRNNRGNDQIDGISKRWKRQLLHLTFIFVFIIIQIILK